MDEDKQFKINELEAFHSNIDVINTLIHRIYGSHNAKVVRTTISVVGDCYPEKVILSM